MGRRKNQKKTLPVDESGGVSEKDDAVGLTDEEEASIDEEKKKRGPTSMSRLIAAAKWGKKAKIDYDDLGRPLHNANSKSLQSFIGCAVRSIVPINIKSWPSVPKNMRDKVWEEVLNVFDVAPQSEAAVMSSAAQKWRDFKNKMNSRFVWPYKETPEKLTAPPEHYQIPLDIWKDFVDQRLHPSWEENHEKQKQRSKHCKYHHRMSRKGYAGLEHELKEKKVFEDDEEVDRSILWRKAREDRSGNITNEETSEVAGKIDELLEKKKKGEFTASGSNDILTTALGTEEHYGRVRGVGGFVKPHCYFKIPRKKRVSVSKSLAENLKDQEEEARILKAENEKLKAELARIKSNIEDRNVERVASNKSSHTNAKEKEEDDLEIFDCGNSTNKGRKCYLVVKDSGNRVGCGTIVSEENNNWMVSVDVVFDEQAELPVATKSGARLIGDVVGAIVGWPKELLTFEATKKRKNLATPSAGDVDQETFKKVELSLPMPCKYLYLYAVKMMSNAATISVVFDKFMFGREDNTYLLREDLLEFLEMREIGSRQIVVYMRRGENINSHCGTTEGIV